MSQLGGIGEYLRKRPREQGGIKEDFELAQARRSLEVAKYGSGLGVVPSRDRDLAALDYTAAAEQAGIPAGIDREPLHIYDRDQALGRSAPMGLDPTAPTVSKTDAELAREYLEGPHGSPLVPSAPPAIPTTQRHDRSPLKRERADLTQGFEALGEAQAAGARAGAEGAQRQAEIIEKGQQRIDERTTEMYGEMDSRARATRMFAMDEQRRMETYRVTVDNKLAEIERDAEEVTTTKIDPNSFYRGEDGEVSWGSKIGSSVAIALSAIGQALTGGPNLAKSIIDDAIERDMKAQYQNLANRRAAVGEKRSALRVYMDRFGDDRAARFASHGQLDLAYARQIEATAQDLEDQRQRTAMLQLAEQKRTEGEQKVAQAAELAARNDIAAADAQIQAAKGEEQIRTNRAQRRVANAQTENLASQRWASQISQIQKEYGERAAYQAAGVEPLPGTTPPREDFEKVRDAVASFDEVERLTRELLKMEDEFSALGAAQGFVNRTSLGLWPEGPGHRRAEAVRAKLAAELNKGMKLGAMDQGTLEILERYMPQDPTRTFKDLTPDIKANLNDLQAARKQLLGRYGFRDITASAVSTEMVSRYGRESK